MTDPEELPEENPETPSEPEPKREPPDYVMKKRKTPFEGAPGKPKAGKGPSLPSAPLSTQKKTAGRDGSSMAAPPTKNPPKLIVPPGAKNLGSVPTSLEGIMATENQGRSTNEVLGILVEAHIQEADAILGRTRLTHEDLTTVTNALDLARHGIGGMFERPMPRVSEWVLSKLRALPSIDGKSRGEFVQAWRSAEERLRAEENSKNRQREKFANA
jgi:hypothetical protein